MAKLRSGFKNTQKEYAVKVISREKITSTTHRNNLLQEVQLLKGLSGSEYTVKFYEAYEDDKNVYIVMELCEGVQLLERMPKWSGRIAEDDVKDIIKKLLNAISYLHLQGVIHRDLKPENLLFATKAKQSSIKIVDFGLSEYVTLDQPLHDIVGTPHYIAPEMLNQSYNIEADCWSLGVIIYYLSSGKHPFEGRTDEAIFKSVKNDDPVFSGPPWSSLSPNATDFVKLLLNKDPKKRMTASQALAHKWLRSRMEEVPLDINIYKSVKSYYCLSTHLKRLAHKSLSKALSEDELKHIFSQFKLLEPTNGLVSSQNFKKVLTTRATPAMKEGKVFDMVDKLLKTIPTMNLEDFYAAIICPHQFELVNHWKIIAEKAFHLYKQEENRIFSADEIAQDLYMSGIDEGSTCVDEKGELNFLGFTHLLLG